MLVILQWVLQMAMRILLPQSEGGRSRLGFDLDRLIDLGSSVLCACR